LEVGVVAACGFKTVRGVVTACGFETVRGVVTTRRFVSVRGLVIVGVGLGAVATIALTIIIIPVVIIVAMVVIIPMIVATIAMTAAMVMGSAMRDVVHINPVAMLQVAVAATIIIIVQSAIDIDGLSVCNDVARFSSITSSIIRASGIGISNATAHESGKAQ